MGHFFTLFSAAARSPKNCRALGLAGLCLNPALAVYDEYHRFTCNLMLSRRCKDDVVHPSTTAVVQKYWKRVTVGHIKATRVYHDRNSTNVNWWSVWWQCLESLNHRHHFSVPGQPVIYISNSKPKMFMKIPTQLSQIYADLQYELSTAKPNVLWHKRSPPSV